MKSWQALGWSLALGVGCVAAVAGIPELGVSVDGARSPAGASGASTAPIISPDGRFILFANSGNNLVLIASTNPIPRLMPPRMNVYVRDRLNGTTALVSANHSGNGGGNGDSWPSGISTNGRYALFESSASDLVPGDTNGVADVFVRDLASGTTRLVSVNTNGVAGNGASRGSVMTPDGRYVAFASEAGDLTAGDTNGIADVFVRDLQADVTVLASVGAVSTNTVSPVGGSEWPDITPDGRYVAFFSTATGLVSGAGTGGDIYVRDLTGESTLWASVGARAAVHTAMGSPLAISFDHALSADGRFVVYEAGPVPGSTTSSPMTTGLVLRYGLQTGSTDLVSTNAWIVGDAGQDIANLDLTPDGRFIAFIANTNGTTGSNTCILVWDAQDGTTVLASGAPDGSVPPNSTCDWPSFDPSGRYVVFLSTATNLTTNVLSGACHGYLRDLQTGSTTLVDAGADGTGVGVSPATVPRLATGPVIAFECFKSTLAGTNVNPAFEVFVRDPVAQTTQLVSAHDPGLPSLAPNGLSLPGTWTLSTDNRYLAFSSQADNLASNETNGCREVFVRDLLLGTIQLVSLATNGLPADGNSSNPSLSADGRYVAFTSTADDLVTNRYKGAWDGEAVFVYDRLSGTTTLASIGADGVSSGNGVSSSPAISADGRFVLFLSMASNLAAGASYGGVENLFLRDRQVGVTYALTAGVIASQGVLAASMTRDGHYVAVAGTLGLFSSNTKLWVWNSLTARWVYTNSLSSTIPAVGISPDGQRLAFMSAATSATLYGVDWASNRVWTIATGLYPASRPGLRFSGDGRFLTYAAAGASPGGTNQVYLYDCQEQTSILVSQTTGGLGGAEANSDAPELSKDGGFLAFRGTATDLVPGATNGLSSIFLYDRTNHVLLLASASRFGVGAADNWCLAPAFSGDGSILVFGSWASDLAPSDFSGSADLFLLSLYSNSVIPLFSLQSDGGAPGQPPTFFWPVMSGKTYRVQFKDNLTNPDWQDLPSSPVILGNQGYLNDPTALGSQRFYRVLAF